MQAKQNRKLIIWNRLLHGIATKMVLMALVVVFIPIYWLNKEAVSFFDVFNRRALESNMRNYAVMIGSQYKQMLSDDGALSAKRGAVLKKQLHDYDQRMNVHIRILDTDGDVLLDSRGAGGDNLLHLREVSQSLSGGYAMRNALTPDRQFMNYYLAWPVKSDDLKEILAIVHIVQDTNPVIQAIKSMIKRQQVATWIALILASVLAVLLAGFITRRLVSLTQSALAFARKETRFKSGLKSRKDEIGQLDDALNLMACEINDRNSYNREFVDTLRHELTSALAGTKGAVETLNDGAKNIPDDRDRFIESIALQTQRMLNLVEQLNKLSKLGVESLRDRKERVDLVELVNYAVDEIRPVLKKPCADIILPDKDDAVEYMVVPELMCLVIQNLVRNALRHTPLSGCVRIEVLRSQTDCRIVVRDNGEGISEEDLPHIFDRFFTTVPKNRVSSGGSGMGLGLAIVKQIVEAHDGTIRCSSVKGEGTEFVISFPL